MTLWCAGLDETAVSSKPAHHNSPDDGHMAARNM